MCWKVLLAFCQAPLTWGESHRVAALKLFVSGLSFALLLTPTFFTVGLSPLLYSFPPSFLLCSFVRRGNAEDEGQGSSLTHLTHAAMFERVANRSKLGPNSTVEQLVSFLPPLRGFSLICDVVADDDTFALISLRGAENPLVIKRCP